jgi:hypothetical protein
MADPGHDKHEAMAQWSEGWRPFDLEASRIYVKGVNLFGFPWRF